METEQQTTSQPQKTNSLWRVSTVVLIIIALTLAAGLVYVVLQLQNASNDVASLTTQRDDLQSQLNTANKKLANQTATKQTDTMNTTYTSKKGVSVEVTSPLSSTTHLASPLTVSGKVPGSWSHEGQFGVSLRNGGGTTIASGTATLDGNWQTDDLVNFTTKLTWDNALGSGTYTLVLEKANPSGIPANADSVEIPLTLK